MQDCTICPTPTNHVRDLTEEMGTDDPMPNHPTSSDLPPPPNHPILLLSKAFKNAIKENRIYALKALSKQFIHQLETNLEFVTYDHSDLATCYQTAEDIINSLSTTTAENPTLVQQPRASFKPPKLDTPAWSGKSADFYPWLSTILNGFNLTQAEDNVKVALTQQAIPLAKRGPFNNIIDWPTFKIKLIEEFGSIDIFGRDVNQTLNLLPCYESVQEVAEDLSTKIKTLQANLEIMQNFHDKEDLHSVALTQPLVQNIMKSLPSEVRPSFNDQFSKFRKQCPANVRPPATFRFLAQFVEEMEKNYRSTPYLYDLDLSPLNLGVNV